MQIKTTESKIAEGIERIKQEGGKVFGTTEHGSVSIRGVEAHFTFQKGILGVRITETPFLVSEDFVEDKIRKFFS